MPHRAFYEGHQQEIHRNYIRRLCERGIGSPMEIRKIFYVSSPNKPLLEQHRGVLRSVVRRVEPGEFSEPDREVLCLQVESHASVRGGLELLTSGHSRLVSGPIEYVTVIVPYWTRIQVKLGIMRFGEADIREQTHDAGLTPLVFIRIWFDPDAKNGNGKKM